MSCCSRHFPSRAFGSSLVMTCCTGRARVQLITSLTNYCYCYALWDYRITCHVHRMTIKPQGYPQGQVIHRRKFKFFSKFIDSGTFFLLDFNTLYHSAATKRVLQCDQMGAMMRRDGCCNATKRVQALIWWCGVATKWVLTPRCDETGASEMMVGRSRPESGSADRHKGGLALSRPVRSLPDRATGRGIATKRVHRGRDTAPFHVAAYHS